MKLRLGFVSNSSSSSYLVIAEKNYDFESLVRAYLAMDGPNEIIAIGKDAVITILEEWEVDSIENVKGLVNLCDDSNTEVYLVNISHNDPGLFEAMRTLQHNNILTYWYIGE